MILSLFQKYSFNSAVIAQASNWACHSFTPLMQYLSVEPSARIPS